MQEIRCLTNYLKDVEDRGSRLGFQKCLKNSWDLFNQVCKKNHHGSDCHEEVYYPHRSLETVGAGHYAGPHRAKVIRRQGEQGRNVDKGKPLEYKWFSQAWRWQVRVIAGADPSCLVPGLAYESLEKWLGYRLWSHRSDIC